MSAWVEEQFKQARIESEAGASWRMRACAATPAMFDALVHQLTDDARTYGEIRNKTIRRASVDTKRFLSFRTKASQYSRFI